MRNATKSENRDKINESRENQRIATKLENRDKIGEWIANHFVLLMYRSVGGRAKGDPLMIALGFFSGVLGVPPIMGHMGRFRVLI